MLILHKGSPTRHITPAILIAMVPWQQSIACTNIQNTPQVQCTAGVITIGGEVPSAELPLQFQMDSPISIVNAGTLSFDGGAALTLIANSIEYVGQGATFSAPYGTAIDVSVMQSSYNHFVLNDTVNAARGLSVYGVDGDAIDIDIDIQSGAIEASGNGIQTSGGLRSVDVTVGEEATIRASAPLMLQSGRSRVTLAGRLYGGAPSLLGNDDSELELHPGFLLEGVVDAGLGDNRFILGGKGVASFDLSEIDSKYKGFQAFSKRGESTWTLTGTAAHPLGLTLEEGTIDLEGNLASGDSMLIEPSGTLRGAGGAGDLEVYGTIELGSAGSLYAEDVVFHPGSMLRIDLGQAEVGGLVAASVQHLEQTRIVVSASGIPSSPVRLVRSERLLAPLSSLPPVELTSGRYRASLEQTAHDLILVIERTGLSFEDFAQTDAERALARHLDTLGEGDPVFDKLDSLTDEEIGRLLRELTGEDLAAANDLLVRASSQLTAVALARIHQQAAALPSQSPLGYAPGPSGMLDPQPARIWGRILTEGQAGPALDGRSVTLTAGMDSEFGAGRLGGLMVGIGGGNAISGASEFQSAVLSAAGYGSQQFGDLSLRLAAGVSLGRVSTRRIISGAVPTEIYTADHGVFSAGFSAEVAQALHLGPVTAELFGNLRYVGVATPAFEEQGGPAALTVAAAWSSVGEVVGGVRVNRSLAFGTVLATASASLAVTSRFTPPPSSLHSVAGSAPFAVSAPTDNGAGVEASAGLTVDLDGKTGVDIEWRARFVDADISHSLSAKLGRAL